MSISRDEEGVDVQGKVDTQVVQQRQDVDDSNSLVVANDARAGGNLNSRQAQDCALCEASFSSLWIWILWIVANDGALQLISSPCRFTCAYDSWKARFGFG